MEKDMLLKELSEKEMVECLGGGWIITTINGETTYVYKNESISV